MAELPHQSNAETYQLYASVHIVTDLHVKIDYSAPHPDMADFEAIARDLERKIEAEGTVPTRGVNVTYATVSAEVDPWTPKAAQHG
jgi:hypothetical protein